MAALAGRAVGEADRAGEIAGVVDLDDGEAAMLLVIRAEAAIPWAAALGPAGVEQGPVAWLQPAADVQPVIRILLDQRLRHAVLGAPFLVEDLAVLADDLRRHQLPARLAQARGLAVEDPWHALAREVRRGGIGERVHRRSGHRGSWRAREAERRRAAQTVAHRASKT